MRIGEVLLTTIQTLLWLAMVAPAVQAQGRTTAGPPDVFSSLPSGLEPHAAALGDRARGPGRERTVADGLLFEETGERRRLRIVLQLPQLVRIDGFRPNSPPLIFNGQDRVYPNSRAEEQLVEIFSSDTTEGMVASIKGGAAVQLLGRQVRSDADQSPERSRRFDVFEVSSLVRSSATGLERLKQYFFDSDTGLLVKTRYIDEASSPPANVEIRFSDWRKQDASAYPGRIERLENGREVFSFTTTSIVALPGQDLIGFSQKGIEEE